MSWDGERLAQPLLEQAAEAVFDKWEVPGSGLLCWHTILRFLDRVVMLTCR